MQYKIACIFHDVLHFISVSLEVIFLKVPAEIFISYLLRSTVFIRATSISSRVVRQEVIKMRKRRESYQFSSRIPLTANYFFGPMEAGSAKHSQKIRSYAYTSKNRSGRSVVIFSWACYCIIIALFFLFAKTLFLSAQWAGLCENGTCTKIWLLFLCLSIMWRSIRIDRNLFRFKECGIETSRKL